MPWSIKKRKVVKAFPFLLFEKNLIVLGIILSQQLISKFESWFNVLNAIAFHLINFGNTDWVVKKRHLKVSKADMMGNSPGKHTWYRYKNLTSLGESLVSHPWSCPKNKVLGHSWENSRRTFDLQKVFFSIESRHFKLLSI